MFSLRHLILSIFLVSLVLAESSIDSIDDYGDYVDDAPEEDPEVIVNKTYFEKLDAIHQELIGGKRYDRNKRPIRNQSQPVTVDVYWHVTHISIDSRDQSMRVIGHLYMTWIDEYLGWDNNTHHGINQLQFDRWQLWRPPIRIINSVTGSFVWREFVANPHVTAKTLGKERGARMETYPTFNVRIACSFDFSAFPNDINSCPMKLFPSVPMAEVTLRFFSTYDPSVKLAWENENKKNIVADYEVLATRQKALYYGVGQNITDLPPAASTEYAQYFSVLHLDIIFKRHSPLFFAGLVLPCVLCALFNTLSFLIPSITFAVYTLMSTMFIQLIFLQDVIKKVPLSMSSIPPCIQLYAFIMIATILSLMFHFVLMILTSCRGPVPEKLNQIHIVRQYLPDTWRLEKDTTDKSWTTWIHTIRPLIAALLSVVYFFAFCKCIAFA